MIAIREFTRNLQVDSTMIGKVVALVAAADGRLESGSTVLVTNDLPLTLVMAPSCAEVDALVEDTRGALRATVRVGLATDPAFYLVEVPWEAARLRAEVLLTAFLGDITGHSEAQLPLISTRAAGSGPIQRWPRVQ
jgi:hypothetical protein